VVEFYLGHRMFKPCVVIPVYNHQHAIKTMVDAVLAHNVPCILIDDGSSTACAQVLDQLVALAPKHVTLLKHNYNQGKGAAIFTGFQHAFNSGYTHALQIDADGQHCAADIPRFLKLATENPQAVIAGYPQYDASVPKLRLYARYLTHVWVWINTLSFAIKDSMCGFRVYPLAAFMTIAQKNKPAAHMDFDIDIIVRLYWSGTKILNTATRVSYPKDGISHFRLFKDNLLITWLHSKLFFGMLKRLPKPLLRKAPKKHWAQIDEFTFITGMRTLFLIFRLCGRSVFRIALYPVVFCYFILRPTARAASKQYLQQLNLYSNSTTVKATFSGVLHHFIAFAEMLLDKMRVWNNLFDLHNIEYYGQHYLLDNIAQQRGGLLICAHLGNLELCRALAKQYAIKLTVLTHTKHAQAFNRLLAKFDPDSQLNLLQVTEISPNTAMLLREKIAHGELVAIAGDRIPVSFNPRITVASFLNSNAPFPVGPYILANLLQCPTYLIFALRNKTGTELHIELFRETIQLPRQQREQLLAELAGDYAQRLAYYCLRAPLQWFNFYDFWYLATR
jgi:predicted LPLAT superfamily acyltransferase